jgi:hypothetical protein
MNFSLADGNEAVNNLARSKVRLGVNEKLNFLQRAEENYYRNENANRQVCLLCIIPALLKNACSLFCSIPQSISLGYNFSLSPQQNLL